MQAIKNRLKQIEDSRDEEKKINMEALEELDNEKMKYYQETKEKEDRITEIELESEAMQDQIEQL